MDFFSPTFSLAHVLAAENPEIVAAFAGDFDDELPPKRPPSFPVVGMSFYVSLKACKGQGENRLARLLTKDTIRGLGGPTVLESSVKCHSDDNACARSRTDRVVSHMIIILA